MAFVKMIPPIVTYVIVAVVLLRSNPVEGVIGVNWGRQSAQRLVPSMVVDLLLQNGVPEVRVFSGREDIIRAFRGSGIGLTITIFEAGAISNMDQALEWVDSKVKKYGDANITRVYIGNLPFFNGKDNKILMSKVISATQMIQDALIQGGVPHVKATVTNPQTILKDNLVKPSEAEFIDNIKEELGRFLPILEANGSPFVVEFFPISFVDDNNMDPDFAFIDNKSNFTVTDVNGLVYRNAFEFLYDSFVWALKKTGYPDLKILVGHVGWPTDGYPGATAASAERFYKSLLPYVVSDKGTPLRPGKPIDIFVHSLTDENRMPYNYPFSRHWGIYRANGEPKFKIDLTGQGRDMYPSRAKGIMRMPQRWCVFNNRREDTRRVWEQFKFACNGSDCTSLAPGGSCSNLNFNQNISYAFNMYFQFNFQGEYACDFSGLGVVVTDNPSVGGCVFPVDVVRGEQENYVPSSRVPPQTSGSRLLEVPECATLILFFLVSISLKSLLCN